MNLMEAISKGAERIDGRARGSFITARTRDDGGYDVLCCALGAAYVGCHPDVDLTVPEPDDGESSRDFADRLENWLDNTSHHMWQWANRLQQGDSPLPTHRVIVLNDLDIPPAVRTWDTLLERLEERPDLGQVEICEDPGGDCA